MTVQNTDDLVVERDGSGLYSLEIQNVMTNLDDTDLMVVCRDEYAYKITGAELKSAISPRGVAPIINSLTLTETNPTVAPRFTDQTFNVAVTMQENGFPVSEKTVNAYVKGTLATSFSSDPITVVNTSPLTSTSGQFAGTTTNVSGVATDGAGHWIALQPSSSEYILGTGAVPTWSSPTSKPSFLENITGICGSTDGRFLMVGKAYGLTSIAAAYSTDFGATWIQSVFSASIAGNTVNSLQISTDNNGTWFFATSSFDYEYVMSFISTDNGANFVAANIAGGSANYTSCTAISGENDEIFLAGQNDDYCLSFDSGATWGTRQTGLGAGFYSAGGSKKGTILGAPGYANWVARFVDGVFIEKINLTAPFISVVSTGGDTWLAESATDVMQSLDDGLTWNSIAAIGVNAAVQNNSAFGGGVYVVVGTDVDNPSFGGYNAIQLPTVSLTVSGEKDLANFTLNSRVSNGSIPADPTYASGNITEINIANKLINLNTPVGTWQVSQNVVSAPVVIDNTTLYLNFDATGAVIDLSSVPPSPSYTTTDNPLNLTLTFPSTFPSGSTPDEELPAGTTLSVDVQASNTEGVSAKTAEILPIVIPTLPVQPEASGIYITNTAGTSNTTISSVTTSPVIAGPWQTNGGQIYAVTKDGNLISFAAATGAQTVKGAYPQTVIDEGIITGSAAYDGQHAVLTLDGNIYFYEEAAGYSCGNANQLASLIGEDIYGLTFFCGLSQIMLAWSNDNKKIFTQIYQSAASARICASTWVPNTITEYVDQTTLLSPITFDLNPGVDIKQIVASGTQLQPSINELVVLFEDGRLFMINTANTVEELITGSSNAGGTAGSTWKQISAMGANQNGAYIACLDSTNVCTYVKLGNGFVESFISMPGDWIYAPPGQAVTTPQSIVGFNSLGECFLGQANGSLFSQGLPAIASFDGNSLDLFLMNWAKYGVTTAAFPIFPARPVSLMTAEEYAETALKFATYENRQMVECGNIAQQKRDQLMLDLRGQGFELEDILEYL